MKTVITMCAASIAALALTVSCSSKTKTTDEPQADTTAYQSSPDTLSTSTAVPTPAETTSTMIPDETARVASLGASSSGRSR